MIYNSMSERADKDHRVVGQQDNKGRSQYIFDDCLETDMSTAWKN